VTACKGTAGDLTTEDTRSGRVWLGVGEAFAAGKRATPENLTVNRGSGKKTARSKRVAPGTR
jgi:hypothetical protein